MLVRCKSCGALLPKEPILLVRGGLVDSSLSPMAVVESSPRGPLYTCQSCDAAQEQVRMDKKRLDRVRVV
jgi:uncharacterized Zn finger protein